MKNIFIALAALFFMQNPALAFLDCVKGKGDSVQVIRSLKDINIVKMSAHVDLSISRSSKTSLAISGPKDHVDNIVAEVDGKELHISSEKCARNTEKLKVHLYLEKLSEIFVLGASDVIVVDRFHSDTMKIQIAGSGDLRGDFYADVLDVQIMGAGDISLKGRAKKLNIDIMGSGDVSSLDLPASEVSVSIKGSGDVKVLAFDTLKVQIYGSGDVQYSGRPKVDLKKFGGGQVKAI